MGNLFYRVGEGREGREGTKGIFYHGDTESTEFRTKSEFKKKRRLGPVLPAPASTLNLHAEIANITKTDFV